MSAANYQPQVTKEHYRHGSYRAKDRWLSYWYQLKLIRSLSPKTVLEIGPGEGVVTNSLRTEGIAVTTCDIATDLKPDIVASVTRLPFANDRFDVALAAEVLEHIRFDDVPSALAELFRVSRRAAVISLPHSGWTFSLQFKLPLFPHIALLFKIPHFFKTHHFNGEHYFELGKKGYSIRKITALMRSAGFTSIVITRYPDDPAHCFFVCKKNP